MLSELEPWRDPLMGEKRGKKKSPDALFMTKVEENSFISTLSLMLWQAEIDYPSGPPHDEPRWVFQERAMC